MRNRNAQLSLFDAVPDHLIGLSAKALSSRCAQCGTQRDLVRLFALARSSVSSMSGRCWSCYNEKCRQGQRRRKGLQPAPPPGQPRNKLCGKCGQTFCTTDDHFRNCKSCRPQTILACAENRTCAWCSDSFTTKVNHQKYCSRSCKKRALEVRLGRRKDYRNVNNRKGRSIRFAQGATCKLIIVRCKTCNALMVSRHNSKFCSKQCRIDDSGQRIMGLYHQATKSADVKRAMAWRRQIVDYLVHRDGADCGICGCHVDITLPSGPRGNKMGPSIDHVVPRSHGGGDEMANLRLTHWICNRQRGNRGVAEQLRLVG